jgi:hypothetical protein
MKKIAQRDRQDGKPKVREAPLQLGIKEEGNSKSKDGKDIFKKTKQETTH